MVQDPLGRHSPVPHLLHRGAVCHPHSSRDHSVHPAVLGEGRVQGCPSLQYSSPPWPQGPATTRGLHLSSSSNALLCPRLQGDAPKYGAARRSSPGEPPRSTASAPLPRQNFTMLWSAAPASRMACFRATPQSLRQSSRGRQLQAQPLPVWTGPPPGMFQQDEFAGPVGATRLRVRHLAWLVHAPC
ncbi:hypothetical protein NDU88_005764 [Pleurodeles waltl]|uniref:Uncharacterized protein n=1 Tax=Pleurodeles waltl TaxID=8319 RepID=A0AAV7UKX0_PLEWA|nr:hypothetical protein NDU88_005764 [Pleurodeles waltl]